MNKIFDVVYSGFDEYKVCQIYLLKFFNGEISEKQLTFNKYDCITPQFSNSGDLITYSKFNGTNYDLFIYDLGKHQELAITHNTKDNIGSRFSYDDRYLVWMGNHDHMNLNFNDYEIFYCDLNNKENVQVTYNNMGDVYPSFSKDSKYIYYESCPRDNKQYCGVFRVNIQTGECEQIAHQPETQAFGIPKSCKCGEGILFEGALNPNTIKSYEVFSYDPEARNMKQLTHFNKRCNVSPVYFNQSNEKVLFRNPDMIGNIQIYMMNSDGRNSKCLTRSSCLYTHNTNPCLTKDDSFIIYEKYKRDMKTFFVKSKPYALCCTDLSNSYDQKITNRSIRGQRFLELTNFDAL